MEQLLLAGHERNLELRVMPTGRDEHAGLAGPFTLILTQQQRRTAYTEVRSNSTLHTEPAKVQGFEATYGVLRAQAMPPRESPAWIEKLLGES